MTWHTWLQPSSLGKMWMPILPSAAQCPWTPMSSPKTAQLTSRTFLKWFCRTYTNTTSVATHSVASWSRPPIGSTPPPRPDRAAIYAPNAWRCIALGLAPHSGTPTRSFARQHNAWSQSPSIGHHQVKMVGHKNWPITPAPVSHGTCTSWNSQLRTTKNCSPSARQLWTASPRSSVAQMTHTPTCWNTSTQSLPKLNLCRTLDPTPWTQRTSKMCKTVMARARSTRSSGNTFPSPSIRPPKKSCTASRVAPTTKVLEAEDVHQLIGLIFCKVYLTRFLQLTFKARKHN